MQFHCKMFTFTMHHISILLYWCNFYGGVEKILQLLYVGFFLLNYYFKWCSSQACIGIAWIATNIPYWVYIIVTFVTRWFVQLGISSRHYQRVLFSVSNDLKRLSSGRFPVSCHCIDMEIVWHLRSNDFTLLLCLFVLNDWTWTVVLELFCPWGLLE